MTTIASLQRAWVQPLMCMLLLSSSVMVLGCGVPRAVSVTWVANGTRGDGPTSLSAAQVLESMQGLGAFTGAYVSPRTTSFSCVDSRGISPGQVPLLETPGGDMAELQGAIVIYHRMMKTKATAASVDAIFRAFVSSKHVSTTRPFYFHTSDGGLKKAFAKVGTMTGTSAPIVLPTELPANKTLAGIWLEALSYGESQGCGHLKYMINEPLKYGLIGAHEAAVPANLIKSYYSFGWRRTGGKSDARSKLLFPILHGLLEGQATVIIKKAESTQCPGRFPQASPAHGGNQVFIYQADAVADFRRLVLTPFFVSYSKGRINSGKFYEHLSKLQGIQLGATLDLLSPVHHIPLYSVSVSDLVM